jgi:hypothetical protein
VGPDGTRIKPHRSETLRGVYPERSVRAQGEVTNTFDTKLIKGEGKMRPGDTPKTPPYRILDFFFKNSLIISLMAISFTLWF